MSDEFEETPEKELDRLRFENAVFRERARLLEPGAVGDQQRLAETYFIMATEQYERSIKMLNRSKWLFGFSVVIATYWFYQLIMLIWGR